jgi:hypothetical protein
MLRLASYKYFNMDEAIKNALEFFNQEIKNFKFSSLAWRKFCFHSSSVLRVIYQIKGIINELCTFFCSFIDSNCSFQKIIPDFCKSQLWYISSIYLNFFIRVKYKGLIKYLSRNQIFFSQKINSLEKQI